MAKPNLTAERLKELFHYDAETGLFTRLVTRHKGRWKAREKAGYQRPDGRTYLRIDGKLYKAHRLAWLYVYNEWPTQYIDHIDGNRSNDSIKNLRDVSRSINMQNLHRPTKHNKSGVLGVHKHEGGKWCAQIRIPKSKAIHLGVFDSLEDAQNAYITAKRNFHPGGML